MDKSFSVIKETDVDYDNEKNPLLLLKEEYNEITNLIVGNNFPLSGDLQVEILCKLPVKSLVRFKIVSKSWNLLISSPFFSNKYLKRNNPILQSFGVFTSRQGISDESNKPSETDREYFPSVIHEFNNIKLIGSCNGLVCFLMRDIKRYLISNPSTKDFSLLPQDPYAYDPNKFIHQGFYFVSKTQEYKIFCLHKEIDQGGHVRILTLGKTHSWKEIPWILPGSIIDYQHAISETGMYWLGVDNNNNGEHINKIMICFDLGEERFRKMDLPPSTIEDKYCRILRHAKGCVMMFVYQRVACDSFDIWILNDDNSGAPTWTKQRKIGPIETSKIMRPMDVSLCDGSLIAICSKNDEGNDALGLDLFSYNLETNEVISSYFTRKWKPVALKLDCVVESLVSINSIVPCIDRGDW